MDVGPVDWLVGGQIAVACVAFHALRIACSKNFYYILSVTGQGVAGRASRRALLGPLLRHDRVQLRQQRKFSCQMSAANSFNAQLLLRRVERVHHAAQTWIRQRLGHGQSPCWGMG